MQPITNHSPIHLQPLPPYNFARTVTASRFLYVLGSAEGAAYRRVLRVDGQLVLIECRSTGSVDQPAVTAAPLAATGPVSVEGLRESVARLLNIGADVRPFYAVARHDPALWRVVGPLYGLHTLRADSVFESVALTIIEQQIALKAAQAGERWLCAWGGAHITHAGATYVAFPTAAQIAAATVDDLTPLKITFRRMQVLIDVAQVAADLEALRNESAADLYTALVKLKGVGHWTAAWAVTRAFGQP
ncbi:MAG: hypothetical protein GYB67_10205, partial [Chloroflexi bacterium]|nr:hypothetical protein [Chloroflexota bacterium]